MCPRLADLNTSEKTDRQQQKAGAFIHAESNSCKWDTTDLFMTDVDNGRLTHIHTHTWHMLDSGPVVAQEIRGMPCKLRELQCGRAKGKCC